MIGLELVNITIKKFAFRSFRCLLNLCRRLFLVDFQENATPPSIKWAESFKDMNEMTVESASVCNNYLESIP